MSIAVERRSSPRLRTFKGATISLEGVGLDCIVRNLSPDGACLDLEISTLAVLDGFELTIRPEGIQRHCRVVWRAGRKMGVAFTKPLAALKPSHPTAA